MNDEPVRYGYGDAGHEYDPDRHGRCRKAGAGYCDGTRTDPQHDRRAPRPVPHSELASAVGPSADRRDEVRDRARRPTIDGRLSPVPVAAIPSGGGRPDTHTNPTVASQAASG